MNQKTIKIKKSKLHDRKVIVFNIIKVFFFYTFYLNSLDAFFFYENFTQAYKSGFEIKR